MGDGNSLVNFGDLTKPATVLIEKISDAIGGAFLPYQIKRVAKAEAEAEIIKAVANIEISEIQKRGLVRMIEEEGKRQENIESITAHSLNNLNENATPEAIENDWLANFFEKCKLISDNEMQSLWAKLLAGEANNPGTFSKRTVNFISTLDKSDAQLFTSFCTFCWGEQCDLPFVYNESHVIYNQHDISFGALKHLESIGLISFDSPYGFNSINHPKTLRLVYYETQVEIEFSNDENNSLAHGKVILTQIGKELAPLCGSVKSDEYLHYILNEWQRMGYKTWVPEQINAMDSNNYAHDTVLRQTLKQGGDSFDFVVLASELAQLRKAITNVQDSSPQAAVAVGEVAKAEIAAGEKNESEVMRHLKAAGKYAMETATKMGTSVAAEVIKKSMGM
jgi:hypothetical protein